MASQSGSASKRDGWFDCVRRGLRGGRRLVRSVESTAGTVSEAGTRSGCAAVEDPVAVSGPPRSTSSWHTGTRKTLPKSTTGRPERPPVSLHSWAMAYALVRPTRSTRAASSTVNKLGTVFTLTSHRCDSTHRPVEYQLCNWIVSDMLLSLSYRENP